MSLLCILSCAHFSHSAKGLPWCLLLHINAFAFDIILCFSVLPSELTVCTPPTFCFAAALDTPIVYYQWGQLFFQQSFPTYESNTNYFRFKIAYSHESAIFCTVWQHTNVLFLQLLDYTTVGKIASLCAIFLRTGNASETFLGFCMEFFQSAVGIHADTVETWELYPTTANSRNGLLLASCLPSPKQWVTYPMSL